MEELTDPQQAMQLHPQDVLNEILRQGARRMLATAIDSRPKQEACLGGAGQANVPATSVAPALLKCPSRLVEFSF